MTGTGVRRSIGRGILGVVAAVALLVSAMRWPGWSAARSRPTATGDRPPRGRADLRREQRRAYRDRRAEGRGRHGLARAGAGARSARSAAAGSIIWRSGGEKAFYLETPTWADVKLETVLAAAVGSTQTLMHVEHVPAPAGRDDVRAVVLSVAEYRRLAAFIAASFRPTVRGTRAMRGTTSSTMRAGGTMRSRRAMRGRAMRCGMRACGSGRGRRFR